MIVDLRDHVRRMARNNLWSNDRLYGAVLLLQPGEFEAHRTGFFPSIAATLNHILSVDLYYLDMMREEGVGLRILDRFADRADATALAKDQAAFDRDLVEFCDALDSPDFDRKVLSDRGKDGRIPERIGDLLAHLFLHDIHHRGQVHAMLSGSSAEPPQLDEFFLDFDRELRHQEVARLGMELQARTTP